MVRTFCTAALAAGILAAPSSAITIDFGGDPNEALVYLSQNGPGARSLGFVEDPIIAIEIRGISPNPKDGGVTGTATSGDITLDFFPLDQDGTVSAALATETLDGLAGARGDWDVTLTDGTETTRFTLAGVGDVKIPDAVTEFEVSAGFGTTTPTVTFKLPDDLPEDVQVFIGLYDLLDRGETTNFARSLLIEGVPASAVDASGVATLQAPPGFIEDGGLYAFAVSTTLRRPAGTFNPSGSSQEGALLVQNTSYAFFTPIDLDLAPAGIDSLRLPRQELAPDGLPFYVFDHAVFAGQVEYYDPLLAIGYDYEIGAGDPFFNSVVLPPIGDGIFEILTRDGTGAFVSLGQAFADQEFTFAAGGVDAFRVLGIELAAGVDPFDPTAFVTGLSFVGDGRFTGSMTPIVAEADAGAAVIPLPASAWLLLAGVGAFGMLRRRRHLG